MPPMQEGSWRQVVEGDRTRDVRMTPPKNERHNLWLPRWPEIQRAALKASIREGRTVSAAEWVRRLVDKALDGEEK